MSALDYWQESLSQAADECGLTLTEEQLKALASAAQGSHENYGMAFYSPPSTDRISEIEREWKAKLDAKCRELDACRANAEEAVKRALRQPSDVRVSIGERGEVFRHDGRTEQIQ